MTGLCRISRALSFRPCLIVSSLAFSGLLMGPPAWAGESPHELPIGDPERRDRQAPVVLDAVVDTRDGAVLDPAGLAARLADTRLLLVGESHTSEEFHRVQEMVLRELHRAGRRVLVGLEMMPTDVQPALDRWSADRLTETDFLDAADWYGNWGYAWEYYRAIFQLARRARLPMLGLNVPRDLVSKVRTDGFESLEKADRNRLPPEIQEPDEAYARHFLSYFDDESGMHSLEGEMLEGFLRAQTAWDASMAWSAVQVLKGEEHQDPKTILVVLVGSGHVAYGYGIARQASPFLDGKIETLIPVPVSGDGEPIESVTASYADYVWGVEEEHWTRFPSLGVSSRTGDDGVRTVLFVGEESPAASLDLQAGDRILSVDGVENPSASDLRRAMGEKHWGDTVQLVWSRPGTDGAEDVRLEGTVYLRRSQEATKADDKSAGETPG